MRTTYAVYGMMEWVAVIPTAHNLVRVRFEGGSVSGYGTTPATFTTDNEAVARLIEKSSYYKSGRIKRIQTAGDESEPPKRKDPQNVIIKKKP